MEQLDFFHLLEVEKKPELRFEDVDPLARLREQVAKIKEQREVLDCGQ